MHISSVENLTMRETILICDDEELVRWSLAEFFKGRGFQVVEADTGEAFVEQVAATAPDVALLDLMLPGIDGLGALRSVREQGHDVPVIMLTAVGNVAPVVEATKLGASGYMTKPFDLAEIGNAVDEALATHRAQTSIATAQTESGYAGMLGSSPSMAKLFESLTRLETVTVPSVLVLGESGTGKDLVARAVHSEGTRNKAPFVEVDCTAIPSQLMESTLFGHEKGSFTDAKSLHRGLFEIAGDGVVFLDEIGELPLPLQAKLLRALENRTFKRVGGNTNLRLDAAVVAATNRDLLARVEAGEFRKDLYYRLAVVELSVPPLRSRRDDVSLLVQHFIERNNTSMSKNVYGVTEEAMRMLERYRWPGNVRELRNVVERMMLFADTEVLDADQLPPAIKFGDSGGTDGCPYELPAEGVDLDSVERGLVVQAIERTQGNQTSAARLLGLSRYALRNRLKKYGMLGGGQ
ncbi:MAG: DNA-binding NtrC family response regulator [Bradymonadia bacterium]|jgi:DNA-binding NtrC family response regulator